MLFETRNGAKCVPFPGPQKKTVNGYDYILMQMLPASPQRLEWVREHNLRQIKESSK